MDSFFMDNDFNKSFNKNYRIYDFDIKVWEIIKNIPCHRVVSEKGLLHGFNKGILKKKELLEKENIVLKEKKVKFNKNKIDFEIQNFKSLRFKL